MASFTMFMLAMTGGAMASTDQYICIPEKSVGIHYVKETKTWSPQLFNPSEKYILTRLKPDDWSGEYGEMYKRQRFKPSWKFYKVGDKMPLATCFEPNVFPDENDISCEQFLDKLDFDRASGRFQLYYSGGYTQQPFFESEPEKLRPKTIDDVFVEIGKCEAF